MYCVAEIVESFFEDIPWTLLFVFFFLLQREIFLFEILAEKYFKLTLKSFNTFLLK